MVQSGRRWGVSAVWVATILLGTFAASSSQADPAAALRVRRALEGSSESRELAQALTTVTKKLRTTEGFDQGGSEFCWVFATLNMLETDYLSEHSDAAPESIELSRWYFEIATGSTGQTGTSADALYFYSPKIGLVANADFSEGGKALTETTFLGKRMSPLDLRAQVIGDQAFWSYAFSDTQSGWHQHPDSDAQPGTLSYYVSPSKKGEILNKALQLGKAVEISVDQHSILVYGADFDDQGNAQNYYIKDSYPDYFYTAAPADLYAEIWEMTTVAKLE